MLEYQKITFLRLLGGIHLFRIFTTNNLISAVKSRRKLPKLVKICTNNWKKSMKMENKEQQKISMRTSARAWTPPPPPRPILSGICHPPPPLSADILCEWPLTQLMKPWKWVSFLLCHWLNCIDVSKAIQYYLTIRRFEQSEWALLGSQRGNQTRMKYSLVWATRKSFTCIFQRWFEQTERVGTPARQPVS